VAKPAEYSQPYDASKGCGELNQAAFASRSLNRLFRTTFSESAFVFLGKFVAYVCSLRPSATDAATANGSLSQSVALINLQSMQAQAHPAFHACI